MNNLPNDFLPNQLHLSENQLDNILLGDAPAHILAHYESCTTCSTRGEEMLSAIHSFTAVTMEWSERRSATLPQQPVTDGSVWGHKLNWALGAGVLAIAIVVLPLVTQNSPGGSKTASADAAQASAPKQAGTKTMARNAAFPLAPMVLPNARLVQTSQVARDNQMLKAIDEELDASVASPAETFGLEASQGAGRVRQHAMPSAIWD
jgi:hypothetical protein